MCIRDSYEKRIGLVAAQLRLDAAQLFLAESARDADRRAAAADAGADAAVLADAFRTE